MLLVETVGATMLMLPTRELVVTDRPCVVSNQSIVDERIANGTVTLHARLPSHATDEAWLKTYQSCRDKDTGEVDLALAIEAFKSELLGVEDAEAQAAAKLKADEEAAAAKAAEEAAAAEAAAAKSKAGAKR